jgi:hypothetical protein
MKSKLLVAAVMILWLVGIAEAKVPGDYYVIAFDKTGTSYIYKRFVSFSDCRAEFRRIKSIMEMTGGQGSVVCVPENRLEEILPQ